MKTKPAKQLNPNEVKTRDLLMVRIIQGVTKAGIQPDRRKEKNRRECRDWRVE